MSYFFILSLSLYTIFFSLIFLYLIHLFLSLSLFISLLLSLFESCIKILELIFSDLNGFWSEPGTSYSVEEVQWLPLFRWPTYINDILITECPKIYRKSVLHLLKLTPCDAKFKRRKKCPCSHNDKTALIKQISLFDTAFVMTNT